MNIMGFIRGFFSVTPSDTTEIAPGIGLYVGAGGDLVLVAEDLSEGTLLSVPSGFYVPGRFIKVKATGTTATAIVGLR